MFTGIIVESPAAPSLLEEINGVLVLDHIANNLREAGAVSVFVISQRHFEIEAKLKERPIRVEVAGSLAELNLLKTLSPQLIMTGSDYLHQPQVYTKLLNEEDEWVEAWQGSTALGIVKCYLRDLKKVLEGRKATPSYFNPNDGFLPIADEPSRADAEKWLRRRPGKAQDPYLTRLYRQMARPLIILGVRYSIKPEYICIGGFILSLVSALILMSSPSPNFMMIAAVLIPLSAIADVADGGVARLTHRTSKSGAVLDANLDRWGDALLIAGMAAASQVNYAWVVGFVALTGSLLTPYYKARWEVEYQERYPRKYARLGINRDIRMAIMAIFIFIGVPLTGLYALAISTTLDAFLRLILNPKRSL